jgi:HTH-type transcriptional regulator/antitoxin HigA
VAAGTGAGGSDSDSRTKIDGACLWLEGKHPVVGLSFRYDRIDWFWFTLMHELGHVQHEDGRSEGAKLDIELVGAGARPSVKKPAEEQRADRFAMEYLLDQRALDAFVAKAGDHYSTDAIVTLAAQLRVHAGILVGQLQHRQRVPYSHFRSQLVKVRDQLTPVAKVDGWGMLHINKPPEQN